MYSTTAAISSALSLSPKAGMPAAAVGDDGDLVGRVRIDSDDSAAGEARADASGSVAAVAHRAVVAEHRRPVNAAGSLDGGRRCCRRLLGLVGEQQHDSYCDRHGDDPLDDERDPAEHQRSTPIVRKNHHELVSQISTRTVNSSPPTTGSAHPGMRRDRTTSTFVANAP